MTPGLARRLAAMAYEALLAFAVAFFAAWLFFFASGTRDATRGALRTEPQLFIVVEVTPRKAVLRFLLALTLLPLSILWALVDRDRQFLHDRLAGTRLIDARSTTS